MSHTEDVAHSHYTRAVDVVRMQKTVTHVPPGGGRSSLWVLGELLTYKVTSHRTGGAYCLFDATTQPWAGPPPHIHHREDESFYMMEGEYEFASGEETLRVGAGSLLYVPKGTLHAHKNIGEGVGRMLISQTPGGLYEYFFEEVGKPPDDDGGSLLKEEQAGLERMMEVAAKYGIEIPSPDNRAD